MWQCSKCHSNKIKTRTNKSFGKKSTTTAVKCKECGSMEIIEVQNKKTYRKRT